MCVVEHFSMAHFLILVELNAEHSEQIRSSKKCHTIGEWENVTYRN